MAPAAVTPGRARARSRSSRWKRRLSWESYRPPPRLTRPVTTPSARTPVSTDVSVAKLLPGLELIRRAVDIALPRPQKEIAP